MYRIVIDGEPLDVAVNSLSVRALLELARVSTQHHYLQRVVDGQPEQKYHAGMVALENGDAFITVYTGTTTQA